MTVLSDRSKSHSLQNKTKEKVNVEKAHEIYKIRRHLGSDIFFVSIVNTIQCRWQISDKIELDTEVKKDIFMFINI